MRQSLHQAAIEVGLDCSDEGDLANILAMQIPPRSSSAKSSLPKATSKPRAVSSPRGSPQAGPSTASTPPFPSSRTPSTGSRAPSTTVRGRAPSTGPEAANKIDKKNNSIKRSSSPAPQQSEDNRQEEVSYFAILNVVGQFLV